MDVPDDARPFMTMPAVGRKFVCSNMCIDGQMISGDSFLTARLRVLPMGWSWALWCCQSVHEHIGRSVGHADSDQASDKTIPHPLSTHDSVNVTRSVVVSSWSNIFTHSIGKQWALLP